MNGIGESQIKSLVGSFPLSSGSRGLLNMLGPCPPLPSSPLGVRGLGVSLGE